MGEATEDMLDGSVCQLCGEWFHDDAPGKPRTCEGCGGGDVLKDAPKDGRGGLFAVIKLPLKWKPYSPKSQEFKRGIKGRWQIWNGYGFENADVEAIDGWEESANG